MLRDMLCVRICIHLDFKSQWDQTRLFEIRFSTITTVNKQHDLGGLLSGG